MWANSVAFSPDGRFIASANYGTKGSDIRLWEVASGRLVRTFGQTKTSTEIKSVAFSPDGRRLVSGGVRGEGVRVWDVQSGRQVWHSDGEATAVAFSPDGRRVASAGSSVFLRDADSGRKISELGEIRVRLFDRLLARRPSIGCWELKQHRSSLLTRPRSRRRCAPLSAVTGSQARCALRRADRWSRPAGRFGC